MQLPAVVTSKLFRPRIWIGIATIGWGLASTLQAVAFNFQGLLAARFFLGVFEAGFGPMIPLYFTFFYTRNEIGVRLAVWFGFAAVAGAFGGLIAYGVQHIHGPIANWRILFLVEGLPTIALGIFTLFALPDRPDTTKWLHGAQKDLAIERMSRGGMREEAGTVNRSHVFAAFKDWKVYAGGVIYFGVNIALASISVFLPTIIKSFGYTNANAQLLTVPPYAVAAIFMISVSYISDRIQSRGLFMSASSGLGGIGYLLLLVIPSNQSARYFAIFLCCAGTYTTIGLALSWFAHNLGSESKKAAGIPLLMIIGQCGSVLGTHVYPTSEGPRYIKGLALCCGFELLGALTCLVLTISFRRENARRDRIYGHPEEGKIVDTRALADESSRQTTRDTNLSAVVRTMSNSSFSSATSVSDDNQNVDSGVGISASSYGTKQRKLLDLINRLHNTGIQSDIDLPQICVVGSQSAGKSSLIESISGIKLPRATGTCTRCPTECRLSFSTEPWSCTVHLRFLKDENGNDISPVRNITFGGVITDKDQVEDRLRRAQLAILNPGVNATSYLGDIIPTTSSDAVAFSENFVSVEISGPDVTNLSFCDLPGIIANVREGSDEGDIDLVKRLVTSYIRKDSCIILLTVTCETDYENQGARSLAKQYDPQGKRTIGVLTKPDRIEKGEEQKWLGFIRGETEVLSKGWFCVKQPSPSELEKNLTWREARAREEEFFMTHEPWSSQMITVRQHFGTARLTSRLSEILSDHIAKRMPSLLNEIHRLHQGTMESLRALPDEISDDPAAEVLNLVMKFHRQVEMHVEGIPDGDGLIQQIRTVQDKFRQAIRHSAPDFRPFKRPSNDEEKEKDPKMPDAAFLNEEESAEVEDISDRTLFEDDVSKLSDQAVTRELPKNVPFIVKRELIKSFVDMWGGPTITLLEDVERILSVYMRRLVDSCFKQHSYGGLHNAVGAIVAERIMGCREYADAQTQFALNIENNQTFTTN
ncbi:hypothetical protein FS749_007065, partial [Ceratobasidium sp. UAMH 11750]